MEKNNYNDVELIMSADGKNNGLLMYLHVHK